MMDGAAKRVCTLVVTYNRKQYLVNLLEALQRQSYHIDTILIFDNASTDGTFDMLVEEKYVEQKYDYISLSEIRKNSTKILYYRNNENTGGSGGFHDGIELAMKQNCDCIWTMDDDVLPDDLCLEKMIKYLTNESRLCIPSRSDDRYMDYAVTKVDMSNPIKYNVKMRKTVVPTSDIHSDYIEVKDMAFEGPLFDISLVKEIGLPQKDFFILFDDSEYAYRASKVTNLRFVKGAILHKQLIPQEVEGEFLNWKSYYGFRNQYWFDRTYGESIFVKKIRPALHYLDILTRIVLKRKWDNIKILNHAYYDGTHGIMGKPVPPSKNFVYKK